MTLTGATRAPATLLGAAAAGVLLWVAGAHVDRHTTGGYWAAYGLVAAAGLLFGASQLRGGGGHPRAMLLLGFLPVLVVAGWILVAQQPTTGWGASRVRHWSGDIGVLDVVRAVATWLGVLAFGIGMTLAAAFEPLTRRRRVVAAPADTTAADEPTTAERREVEERETVAG
ncbi:MAG TPA: hypothetical protein VGC78_04575 [Gaiellaceae bacterium]|jgi:hypothetical protein